MLKIVLLIFLYLASATLGHAVLVTENTKNSCNILTDVSNLYAVYEPEQYDCAQGFYLPKNHLGCEICPFGYTCDGGVYSFNENTDQGLIMDTSQISQNINYACEISVSKKFTALFEPKTYDCDAGYYLPANTDGCTICPENSYCMGGTYTFNETETQGITACLDGLFAPAGMWQESSCGRILHVDNNIVYLRSVKLTTPSLNIDMNGDGTPDFFGNMTTNDVYMHDGADKKFKVQYNGQTYSVYDDTIIP